MERKNDIMRRYIISKLTHNEPVTDAELDYLYVSLNEMMPSRYRFDLLDKVITGNDKEDNEDD